jgi:4-alpha-glucanotransferase
VNLPRCAGILLHPTSLPSRFGVGDFGPEAFAFADRLAKAGHRLWQVLPLGPIGYGDSPYQSFSAFAGEPLLISPDLLVRAGLLAEKDLTPIPEFSQDHADYGKVRAWKLPLLAAAFENFKEQQPREQAHSLQQFCADQAAWLDDYSLFVALRRHFGSDKSWTQWDRKLVQRDAATLAQAREEFATEIECQKYWQFLFYQQWGDLRRHCSALGIRMMGDIPIYVSHDSADVWAQPKQFLLDEHGNATAISGVPPDYFSNTGQLWGNPIYNWPEMERSGFNWWIQRFLGTFRLYDVVRVDHFRGFEAFWEVPAGEKTAINGRWVKAPGEKLFRTVTAALGQLEIVAENLGVITPEVEALREKFHYPGMAVLQFAFGIEGQAAGYRPHNLERAVAAYTGTHDNDTLAGWWNSEGGDSTRTKDAIDKEKEFVLKYLGDSTEPIHWKMMRALFGSVARVAIVPMQDVLGLGSEARMNRPGVGAGNWRWRMLPDAFSDELVQRLHELALIYDRIPNPPKPNEIT